MVRDDPGLQGGAPRRIGEHAAVRIDLARVELTPEILRGRVRARHADQHRRGAEGPHVLGHVGGAPQPKLLLFHVDDEDRRFRRHAGRVPPEIPVQDHVADHEHAFAAKALDTLRERAAREARRDRGGAHFALSGRHQGSSPGVSSGTAARYSSTSALARS